MVTVHGSLLYPPSYIPYYSNTYVYVMLYPAFCSQDKNIYLVFSALTELLPSN
jgi:hypothetical protein